MFEYLKHIDTELFLYLNGKHNAFWDVVMYWAGNKFFWIPCYAVLAVVVVMSFKKKSWLVFVMVALAIAMSDQSSVHLFKNVFMRYRPTHNLIIMNMVHILHNHRGGQYGFVSSHASNTFTLATFITLLFGGLKKQKIEQGLPVKKWLNYIPYIMFTWCSFVSYSRVYAGVHYPADITGGAMLGLLIGFIVWKLFGVIWKGLPGEG